MMKCTESKKGKNTIKNEIQEEEAQNSGKQEAVKAADESMIIYGFLSSF